VFASNLELNGTSPYLTYRLVVPILVVARLIHKGVKIVTDGIESIVKQMLEKARQPYTEDQRKAGEAFNLGVGTVKDLTDANRRARESRSPSLRRAGQYLGWRRQS
jgi:hypothetical protein